MTKEDEILRQLASLNQTIHENNKEIMDKFAEGKERFNNIDLKLNGDGALNEGIVPMLIRHDKILVSKENKQPREGVMGWIEKHPNTVKYALIAYFVVFHGALAAKLLKLI